MQNRSDALTDKVVVQEPSYFLLLMSRNRSDLDPAKPGESIEPRVERSGTLGKRYRNIWQAREVGGSGWIIL